MKNFKSNLSKNSKFNTINFNEKNILTRQVSQKFIRKKYGNKISLLFSKNYNYLFEESIKHLMYENKKNDKKTKILSLSKLFYSLRRLINFFLKCTKIVKFFLIFNIFRKKVIKKDLILFLNFDYHNQMSFTPIVKELQKKNINYYIFFSSIDDGRSKIYENLYKNKNILNYYKFLHIEIFLNLFFKCLKNWFKYKKFVNFYFKNHKASFSDFLKFEISYEIYLKLLDKINPKSIIVKTVIGNEPFIAACKSKNIKTFGYAVQGVSLTTQSLTSQFLFNSLDNLFCYGQSDFIHFSNLQKKKFDVPDKIFICGSARDFDFARNLKNNFNKKKRIIYIRSSHIWLNNIDGKYLKMVAKVIKNDFQNKFEFKIKEKGSSISKISKDLITKNIIKKENLIVDNYNLTENIISKSDIIMGTVSTSILYQGLYFNKVIVQLGSKFFPWLRTPEKLGIIEISNEIEIKKILKLLTNNRIYPKLKKRQNSIRNFLISKKNSASYIVSRIK